MIAAEAICRPSAAGRDARAVGVGVGHVILSSTFGACSYIIICDIVASGTGSSNLLCSSEESGAKLTLSDR